MRHLLTWIVSLVSAMLIGYGAALILPVPALPPQSHWHPQAIAPQPPPAFEVQGIGWAGTRTPAFDDTIAFFQEVLHLPLSLQSEQFAEFQLPGGDRLGITKAKRLELGGRQGPQFEFLVSDIQAAKNALTASGVSFLGDIRRDETSGIDWIQFWGPDGYIYGLTSVPKSR
jgi:predicted enzyme related to lactoylglutathione lyase